MKTASFADVKKAVVWASRVPFYARKLKKVGVSVTMIRSFDDLEKLPPMTADDLRSGGKDFQIYHHAQKLPIYALYATGGTTGKSKLIYYSEAVLERVAKATSDGIAQFIKHQKGKLAVMFVPADNLAAVGEYTRRAIRNLGMFTGGPGILHNDKLKHQSIGVMEDTRPHFIVGNPAQLGALVQYAQAQNFSLRNLGIKFILSTSEVLGDKARKYFEQQFGAKVYEGGGMTEVGWSTMECTKRNGQHVLWNVFAEVRDMQTGALMKEGTGEFYLTTTVNDVYPLVRYKTEDVVTITNKRCACGSTAPRMWYRCRMSESLTVEGTTLYAYHIDDALKTVHELSQNYTCIIRGAKGREQVVLRVEADEKHRSAYVQKKAALAIAKMLVQLKIVNSVGLANVGIEFVDHGALPRTPRGKIALRISDERTHTS